MGGGGGGGTLTALLICLTNMSAPLSSACAPHVTGSWSWVCKRRYRNPRRQTQRESLALQPARKNLTTSCQGGITRVHHYMLHLQGKNQADAIRSSWLKTSNCMQAYIDSHYKGARWTASRAFSAWLMHSCDMPSLACLSQLSLLIGQRWLTL